MNRITIASIALVSACVLALAACGGGGNGNGYDDPDDVPLDASDVDRESAILQTGGSPPIVSASRTRSQQITVRDQGDLYYVYYKSVNEDGVIDGHGSYVRDCSSATCTGNFFHRYEDTFFTPIMTKDGIPLAKSIRHRTTGDGTYSKYLGYGGWMDHSMFAVFIWGYRRHYEGEYWFGGAGIAGHAFGNASKSNPSVGPFHWNGVMVGRNSNIDSDLVSNVVQGDAMISAELSRAGAMSIDVEFSNIQDLNSGNSVAGMRWNDVPVVDGSFEGDKIHGSFYGPQHEEVAGAFEKNQVIGAFGGRR